MDLLDYLRVVRRRWLTLLLTVEAALAVGFAIVAATAPLHASTARLFVANAPYVEDRPANSYEGHMFASDRLPSYVALMTGPRVVEAVTERLGLALTADELRERLRVRPVPDTVLLEVQASDPDPEAARRLTQAFVEEFVALVPTVEQQFEGPANVLVVEPPSHAEQVAPRPVRSLAAATLVGLLVGVGLAVLRDSLDRRLTLPDQVASVTGAPPLAVLSTVPGRGRARAGSRRREELEWLATRLQLLDGGTVPRSLLVAAAGAEPVTTTLPVDLALALADAGVDVVLVDAQLREPVVAEALRLGSGPGLADVLVAEVPLDGALQSCGGNLRVVTAGRVTVNPRQTLEQRALAGLLADLQERCDLVLVAGPPLLGPAESAVLAAETEGVLLLVPAGVTDRAGLSLCLERVSQLGSRMLGTVLLPDPRPEGRAERAAPPQADIPRPRRARDARRAAGVTLLAGDR